jgi:cytochrome P450
MTSMFFTNEPEHARMRGMYNKVITPRRVNGLRGPISDIVERLLNRMSERGDDGSTMDFMTEFAIPMPGDVICELMGIPDENRAWFIPRAHIFGDLLDMGSSSAALLHSADQATVELTAYFADLIKLRQADPRDDMIGTFAQLQLTDERADEAELLAGLLTFFNAGFASTSHLLGNGLPVLIDHPEVVEAIRTDENVAGRFVEEVLRHEPPTHLAVRVASEDRNVAGVTIGAGSMTLVLIGAANYDPVRFADPGTFDPFRPDNRPLTFGAGPHYCLGAALTRLEGQVAFPMLFDRFPKLAPAGERVQTNRLTLHGYKSLPITVA